MNTSCRPATSGSRRHQSRRELRRRQLQRARHEFRRTRLNLRRAVVRVLDNFRNAHVEREHKSGRHKGRGHEECVEAERRHSRVRKAWSVPSEYATSSVRGACAHLRRCACLSIFARTRGRLNSIVKYIYYLCGPLPGRRLKIKMEVARAAVFDRRSE